MMPVLDPQAREQFIRSATVRRHRRTSLQDAPSKSSSVAAVASSALNPPRVLSAHPPPPRMLRRQSTFFRESTNPSLDIAASKAARSLKRRKSLAPKQWLNSFPLVSYDSLTQRRDSAEDRLQPPETSPGRCDSKKASDNVNRPGSALPREVSASLRHEDTQTGEENNKVNVRPEPKASRWKTIMTRLGDIAHDKSHCKLHGKFKR